MGFFRVTLIHVVEFFKITWMANGHCVTHNVCVILLEAYLDDEEMASMVYHDIKSLK